MRGFSFWLKQKRYLVAGISASLIVLIFFQNCDRIHFSRDYEIALSSLNAKSPLSLNGNKAINSQIVPVTLNVENLESTLQDKVLKIRYSFRDSELESKPWEEVKSAFNADLGNLFAADGTLDGDKILYVDLQIQSNQKSVRISGNIVLDTIAPNIISYTLNHGESPTSRNFNEAQLVAQDERTAITDICLTRNADIPKLDDPCWTATTSFGTGLSSKFSFENIPFIIGFLQGTYTSYTFVRDEAGNISSLSKGGLGTDQKDRTSIVYNPPIPPVVTDVFGANSDDMNTPPLSAELKIQAGGKIFLRWKIISSKPLISKPIKIYITTDEKNYTVVQEGLANASNGGCRIDGSATGCVVISNLNFPTSYFRLRVSVQDINGQIAAGSSLPMNADSFQVLAGNTDPGLEGSATAAMLFNNMPTNAYINDPQSFVITDKGQVIFRDVRRGLLISEPKNGLIRILLPLGSKVSEGPLSEAQLNSVNARIALDYQGRLLVADLNSVRRIDLVKNDIITLIGGGKSLDNEAPARSFQYSICDRGCPIYPLPNGDIYFATGSDANQSFANAGRIRKYAAANEKINSYKISGLGTAENSQQDVADSNWQYANFSIGFDEVTSELKFLQVILSKPVVGGAYFQHATVDPKTFKSVLFADQVPAAFRAGYLSEGYLTDKKGGVYAFSRLEGSLKKYDATKKIWTPLLGSGTNGFCTDSVKALSCNVDLQSIFVGLQGRIFFADRGRIRVLNDDTSLFSVAGQPFNFGDGGYAASARFGLINYFDFDNNRNFIVFDPIESRLREFKRRSLIDSVAGNGENQLQVDGSVAYQNSMYSAYWGGNASFILDPETGDITIGAADSIMQLRRQTGKWVLGAGNGGTRAYQASGSPGKSMSFNYPPLILGYQNGKVLVATHEWSSDNGGFSYGCQLNLFETQNSFLQSLLVGNGNQCGSGYGTEGGKLINVQLAPTFSNGHLMATYLNTEKLWLGGQTSTNRIVEMKEGADQVVRTRVQLPRTIASFSRTLNFAGQEVFYYCSTETARIYKYNSSTQAETALPWPNSSISCAGFRTKYDESSKSVIFSFTQNGLYGIGEIADE